MLTVGAARPSKGSEGPGRKPGSALYIVWQQIREDSVSTGAFRFQRDLNDLFGLPATNVFLVKFSYWLNL
jgi:hypothetical protein